MDYPNEMITIVLAEDHTVLRQGLRSLIERTPGFNVVGEAADGLEAVRLVQDSMPNLLIIDLTMPRLNGIDAIKEIKQIYPDIKIIVLTVHTAEEYVFESLKAGADGYMLKASDYDEVVLAIKTVLQGKMYLSPNISDTVVMGYLRGGADKEPIPGKEILTQREHAVLKLVAEGYKNREITSN